MSRLGSKATRLKRGGISGVAASLDMGARWVCVVRAWGWVSSMNGGRGGRGKQAEASRSKDRG